MVSPAFRLFLDFWAVPGQGAAIFPRQNFEEFHFLKRSSSKTARMGRPRGARIAAEVR
jgi:hypothetical protein